MPGQGWIYGAYPEPVASGRSNRGQPRRPRDQVTLQFAAGDVSRW